MGSDADLAQEIARLKEQSEALHAEFEREQDLTQTLQARAEKADEEVANLGAKAAELSADRAVEAMREEHRRLDKQAFEAAAAKADMESHRSQAAELLAEIRNTQVSARRQIDDTLTELKFASNARIEAASQAWRDEQELLGRRIQECTSEVVSLQASAINARHRVGHARRRTAVARLGRAAARWKQEVCIKGMRQERRRTKAAALRKLNREQEEIDEEVTRCREALNTEIRRAEKEDKRVSEEHRGEIKGLRAELEQLEDRIEAAEERRKQKVLLAKAVNVAPISEADRVKRWADAVSGVGCDSFQGAARRLRGRALAPGFGEDDEHGADASGSRRLRNTASAPSLHRLMGGLRQLEEQMKGHDLPP